MKLRHTHATLLLGANVHPKVVSERLGHATVGITLDTYSHVLPTSFTPVASASGLAANPALSSADLASNFSATWDTTSLAPFPFP